MCMMRKLMILLTSLLMLIGITTQTSYAQDFQVTPVQLKQTNLLFNKLEHLEKQDSLSKILLDNYSKMNKLLMTQDSLRVQSINVYQSIVADQDETIEALDKKYAKKEKQCKTATGFAIGGGATSLCLLLLLILL